LPFGQAVELAIAGEGAPRPHQVEVTLTRGGGLRAYPKTSLSVPLFAVETIFHLARFTTTANSAARGEFWDKL
jgi:hypothetical protein